MRLVCAWGQITAARIDLESCHLGKYPWKVTDWKIPFLGKSLTSKTGIKSVCKITNCTLDAPVKYLQLKKWLLPVDFTTGENTNNNNNN